MKQTLAALALTLVVASSALAQAGSVEQLMISIEGINLAAPGGEQRVVMGGAAAGETGQPVRHGFSVLPDGCIWLVARAVDPGAHVGWDVEVTPLRTVDDAVTFRLVWARTREQGTAVSSARHSVERTLRAGESIPLDTLPYTCVSRPSTIGILLRAGVVRYPDPALDHRLVGVDMWLVETAADGTERSQALSLRGQYHVPVPFHFDSIASGSDALDFFGEVTVAPGGQTNDVTIETRRRVANPVQPRGQPGPRQTSANLRIAPNEVVAVQLPPVDDLPAFASRVLSLRVRVRQLR